MKSPAVRHQNHRRHNINRTMVWADTSAIGFYTNVASSVSFKISTGAYCRNITVLKILMRKYKLDNVSFNELYVRFPKLRKKY